ACPEHATTQGTPPRVRTTQRLGQVRFEVAARAIARAQAPLRPFGPLLVSKQLTYSRRSLRSSRTQTLEPYAFVGEASDAGWGRPKRGPRRNALPSSEKARNSRWSLALRLVVSSALSSSWQACASAASSAPIASLHS